MSASNTSTRVSLITGAGSGIGLALARVAAARGHALVLADVEVAALDQARCEFEDAGVAVLARRIDVSDAAAMDALAEDACQRFGGLHELFNNAGVGTSGLLWENSESDAAWTLAVNLQGVLNGIRAGVPRMLACAARDPGYRGVVVNTASMAGLLCPPLTGLYNASKHAVVALSETLHHELALVGSRVRAAVLCPPWVPTRIHESERNRSDAGSAATPAQKLAQALVGAAVTRSRLSAAQVAETCYAALDEGRFWILPEPAALAAVRERYTALLGGDLPPDPYAGHPGLRQRVECVLRVEASSPERSTPSSRVQEQHA